MTNNTRNCTPMKKIIATLAIVAALGMTPLVAACTTDADVASENLSKAADQFEIERRVIFYNGITDSYMLTIEGLCSIEDEGNQLEVVCKNEGGYAKHFLGLSDNVSYFVEQIGYATVSTSQYRVTFKPSIILPNVEN